MRHILKCTKCGSYGLIDKCECAGMRIEVRPPKFSPEDKYGQYRRDAKNILLKKNQEQK
jgi:H/ACA ribonucleoprotein complex subunit 3